MEKIVAANKRLLGFVILTLEFRQEGPYWLGRCRELSTSTYAKRFSQVRKELAEMVELHLNTLEQVGERERFFKEHNIRFYTDQELAPKEVDGCLPTEGDTLLSAERFPVLAA